MDSKEKKELNLEDIVKQILTEYPDTPVEEAEKMASLYIKVADKMPTRKKVYMRRAIKIASYFLLLNIVLFSLIGFIYNNVVLENKLFIFIVVPILALIMLITKIICTFFIRNRYSKIIEKIFIFTLIVLVNSFILPIFKSSLVFIIYVIVSDVLTTIIEFLHFKYKMRKVM